MGGLAERRTALPRSGRSDARYNQPEAHRLLARLLLQELEPVAPPRTVDYEVETDELALLQVGLRCCRWVCTAGGGRRQERGDFFAPLCAFERK